MTTPPLGPERPALDHTCGRQVDGGYCGASAVWHFAWSDDLENGLCCAEHADEALAKGWGVDWHPIGAVCTLPGTLWVGSTFAPPGRCEWVLSDGTAASAATADAPQPVEVSA